MLYIILAIDMGKTNEQFQAAIKTHNAIVVEASPKIGWMVGRGIKDIYEYCNKKNWNVLRYGV